MQEQVEMKEEKRCAHDDDPETCDVCARLFQEYMEIMKPAYSDYEDIWRSIWDDFYG